MKKIVFILICVLLLSSCHQSKPQIVEDFIDAENSFDKVKANKYLADNFTYYGTDTLNK